MPAALFIEPVSEPVASPYAVQDAPSASDAAAAVAHLLSSPAVRASDLPDLVCETVARMLPVDRVALLTSGAGAGRVLGTSGIAAADVAREAPPAGAMSWHHGPRLVSGRIDASDGSSPAAGTLLVVPIMTCDRRLGVLLADREGGRIHLDSAQLDDVRAVSSALALALAACRAGMRHERASHDARRLDLARELHDGVVQRLFAVSTLLGSDPLDTAGRGRCQQALEDAAAELRRTVWEHVAGPDGKHGLAVTEERRALAQAIPGVEIGVDLALLDRLPAAHREIAERMLAEGMRNARKHAAPTRLQMTVTDGDGTVTVELRNDGVAGGASGRGLGLKLLGIEALRHGGLVDATTDEEGWWRLTLTLPATS